MATYFCCVLLSSVSTLPLLVTCVPTMLAHEAASVFEGILVFAKAMLDDAALADRHRAI